MDKFFKTLITIMGAVVGYLWGWSPLLLVLLVFVIFDYGTGMAASWTEGRLNSKIGFKSIPKKVTIFALVAVAHLIDGVLPGANHMFRDAVIFFYLGNELLSIIENAGRMGVKIPDKLKQAVEILGGKSDDK